MISIFAEIGIPRKYDANNLTALKDLRQAVDALRAKGGGDCAEFGMTGILNALSLASSDSHVIVLTDAPPKDVEKKENVIAEAMALWNSIHFFLDSECGDPAPYLDVAHKTHGVVVHHIDDFESFAEFADKVVGEGFITRTLGHDRTKRGTDETYCVQIPVSVFTKSIDMFFSSVSSKSVITITNPLGEAENIITNGSTATYNATSPIAGTYNVCSNEVLDLSVSNPCDLDFFVEYVDVSVSRSSLPSPGIAISEVFK